MIRMLLVFLLVFALFFFGINELVKMKKGELWSLTKVIGYSILCSLLTLIVLVGIVVLF